MSMILVRVTNLRPDNNGAPLRKGDACSARGPAEDGSVWVEGRGGKLWKLWNDEYERIRHGEVVA
jgi:hypothetical protein